MYRSGLSAGPLQKIRHVSVPKGICSLQHTSKISAGTEGWKGEGGLYADTVLSSSIHMISFTSQSNPGK